MSVESSLWDLADGGFPPSPRRVMTVLLVSATALGYTLRSDIKSMIHEFTAPKQESVEIHKLESRLTQEERDSMFEEGIGIPFDVMHSSRDIEYWKGETEKQHKKTAYVMVCMNGAYSQKLHGKFINPEEAKTLFRVYGWSK